ncbi:MAG: hypothetical protein AABY09_02825 [Nanoarchaeota archaeon]
MHPYEGLYVVIDGIDRIGKGTLISIVVVYEQVKGKRSFDVDAFQSEKGRLPTPEEFRNADFLVLSEPTYSGKGKEIRDVLIRKGFDIPSLNIASAYADDRMVLLKNVILPALQMGKLVISSRSVCSSLVYQPLDAERKGEKLMMNTVLSMPGNVFAMNNSPNLLVIPFVDSVGNALERSKSRGKDDDCKFEEQHFLETLQEVYRGETIKDMFRSRGTEVMYVDTSGNIDDSKRNMLRIWKYFFNE